MRLTLIGALWSWLHGAAANAGYVLAAALLVLLLLAILSIGWLQLQTRASWFRLWDRWPAKNIRRPTLQVSGFDDAALTERFGASVAGLVRGRVTWKTDRFGLNLVSGQAGIASAFSGLGDVSGQAKAAVAVIDFLTALLPRRRFVLTGELQPGGADGVGLSLELSRTSGMEALITFWAAPFLLANLEPAEAYQRLALAAAAWVDIWMVKAIQGEDMLTDDPQSWAFFRSGVDWQQIGDNRKARTLYEQALAKDGKNVGALANLGIICRRNRDYEQAQDYLQRALSQLTAAVPPSKLDPTENPDWYRVKYQIAALYANWASNSHEEAEKVKLLARAGSEARELARTTLEKIAELSNTRHRRSASAEFFSNTLQPFLEGTIAPPLLVLVASTAASQSARDAEMQALPPPPDALLAMLGAPGPDALPEAIDPWIFIAYAERGPNRPPAVFFNLACFYTRTGDFSTATERLQTAVRETSPTERKALIDVAASDPTLAALYAKRPGLLPKLRTMLDPEPEMDAAEIASLARFGLENRAHRWLVSAGWRVHWTAKDASFTWHASREGEWRLIEFADVTALADRDVDTTLGALTRYREDHPEHLSVRALVILTESASAHGVDATGAERLGVMLWRDTESGFIHLSE